MIAGCAKAPIQLQAMLRFQHTKEKLIVMNINHTNTLPVVVLQLK